MNFVVYFILPVLLVQNVHDLRSGSVTQDHWEKLVQKSCVSFEEECSTFTQNDPLSFHHRKITKQLLDVCRVKHHSLGGFRKNFQCSLNQGKNKETAPHMSCRCRYKYRHALRSGGFHGQSASIETGIFGDTTLADLHFPPF